MKHCIIFRDKNNEIPLYLLSGGKLLRISGDNRLRRLIKWICTGKYFLQSSAILQSSINLAKAKVILLRPIHLGVQNRTPDKVLFNKLVNLKCYAYHTAH
jgi:hypothetical protein